MNYEDGDGQFVFFNIYVIEVSLEAFKIQHFNENNEHMTDKMSK